MPLIRDLRSWTAPSALMAAGLLSVASLYLYALPGYWLFDDWPNLFGLAHIEDFNSVMIFIFGGEAGPLGRPISLATFALQAESWDTRPEAMLIINFAIHMVAMIAVFALATGLAHIRDHDHALWVGAFAAILWGISPFLATTHLMVIQRMTSLAGLFMFTGLALFVWAHLINRKHIARAALIIGLGFCTLFAAFSKENGVLLPLLALVILITWIPRKRWLQGRIERALLVLLLVAPTLVLLGHMGSGLVEIIQRGDYGTRRAFSPAERLLTQPVVLLDYLRQLLFPRPVAATPFMDHISASKGWLSPPITLIAALFWSVFFIWALAIRQRAPWALFGLLFFFGAHALESTYIGLELYFAHRNYVPAFGLYFALAFFALTIAPRHFLLVIFGLLGYVFLMGFTLFQVTSHWNDTRINSELWVDYNPNSIRAYQLLSSEKVAELDFQGAREALDQASQRHPGHTQLQIQRTGICVGQEAAFPDLVIGVTEVLRTSQLFQAATALDILKLSQKQDPSPLCPPRTHMALLSIANALLENDVYARSDSVRAQLVLAKAFSHAAVGEFDSAIRNFKESYRMYPNLDVAFHAISLLANMGKYQAAYEFLEEVRAYVPPGRFERMLWKERSSHFRAILEESERIDFAASSEGSGKSTLALPPALP